MPYVQVNLSQTLSEEEKTAVIDLINKKITLIPNKVPEVTMIHIADGCTMQMGYAKDPVVFIDVRLFKPAPFDAKADFVREVTENLAPMFGLNPRYIYFNIQEFENWGSNGGFRQ